VLFFSARDDATTTPGDAGRQGAPGRAAQVPAAVAGDVRRGNVVVLHPAAQRRALAALVRDVTGLPPAEQGPLRAAGQAVLLRAAAGSEVVAYADGRALRATGPRDPALRRFVEFWLGR